MVYLVSRKQKNKISHALEHEKVQQAKGGLKSVLKHARDLLALEAIVSEAVDSYLPGEIKVASLKEGILHLTTPTAALATRINYSQMKLIALLKRQKKPWLITNIKISVRPKPEKKPIKPTSLMPPSEDNGKLLAATAQYIEDEPLREALLSLSHRAMPGASPSEK